MIQTFACLRTRHRRNCGWRPSQATKVTPRLRCNGVSTSCPSVRKFFRGRFGALVLVDLGADEGRTLTLGSFNAGNGTTFVPTRLQDAWDTADFDLLEIRVGSPTADAVRALPERLADLARVPESEAVNAGSPRPFELGVNPFEINGKGMDMAIIDERIRLGDTEVWEVSNPNQQAHPFHVHGDSFQILSRDGALPPANELGWKDVVLLRPFETVRIIKRFRDYADPERPFMFHCHILEHEDVGMMGQFVVEER
ncbi:MAG: multicopper oxidase domain-containing protein [Planctomycetes bacterium]|nr:multicopper oxidase domain-containing protein [Planctomycetota bacterium]